MGIPANQTSDIRPVLSTPAHFYLSVELGFIVCFLHFMHICHARHDFEMSWSLECKDLRFAANSASQ